MGRRLVVVLLIAGLIAAGTAYLSRQLLQQQPLPQPGATVAAPAYQGGIKILVANLDLPTGTIVQPTSFEWRSWPQDSADDKVYILEGNGNIDQFVGSVVRAPVRKGEPIVRSNIIKRGENGFLAAVLREGMRAVTISTNEIFGVAGFVFPGDRVDVILSHDVQMPRADGAGTVPHRVSETIMTAVRVIAVDQSSNDQDTAPKVSNAITVEVSPRQAEELALASRIGELRVTLRSAEEQKNDEKTEQAAAAEAGKTGGGFLEALTGGNAQAERMADKSKQTFSLDSDLSLVIAPPAGAEGFGGAQDTGSSNVQVIRGSAASSVSISGGGGGGGGAPPTSAPMNKAAVGAGPVY